MTHRERAAQVIGDVASAYLPGSVLEALTERIAEALSGDAKGLREAIVRRIAWCLVLVDHSAQEHPAQEQRARNRGAVEALAWYGEAAGLLSGSEAQECRELVSTPFVS